MDCLKIVPVEMDLKRALRSPGKGDGAGCSEFPPPDLALAASSTVVEFPFMARCSGAMVIPRAGMSALAINQIHLADKVRCQRWAGDGPFTV